MVIGLREWSPIFGYPAQVLVGPDEWVVGGPGQWPRECWLWLIVSGPTDRGRRLVDSVLDFGLELSTRVIIDAGYMGIQQVTSYHLLAEDEAGPYVTASSLVLPVGMSTRAIHGELARAATQLRQACQARQSH
jgi:hypothetical protein